MTPLRRSSLLRRILQALMLLAMAGFLGMCLYVDAFGRRDHARPADVIIVLGSGVDENNQPSDSLRARTLHAVELYQAGLAPKIICTGGLGDYAPTEAEAATRFAVRQGVPESDLLRETRSHNTRENARFAAVICRRYGWKRVLVVSEPFHLLRAKRDFEAFGLTTFTSPATRSERDRDVIQRAIWTSREVLALTRDYLIVHTRRLFRAGKY